ncbi:putative polyamine transporter 4 [Stipitochalara longipes BDJ]|nr:putative polyamine transporter 4 [Stipitochalara longipes BDJ]
MALGTVIDKEADINHDIEASSGEKPGELEAADGDTDLETTVPQQLVWESPEDPGNARNWSTIKKVFHTAIPALYGFVITVGTSVYNPAIPLIMAKFDVTREVAILPLALYTAGFTLGPIIAAPLSELYGRRAIYRSTMPLLLVFTAIAGAANSVPLLIVMRFFAGMGGSGALAVGAGTIADLWTHESQGKAALFFILSPFLGPSLGPLIGAYTISEYNNDWRYAMWVIMIIAAPIAVASLFMKETSPKRILFLRQKKLGIQPPHQAGDTRILLRKLREAFLRPLHMMLIEPLVAYLSIYTGFAFAMIFSFFASYSYVFQSVYNFNEKEIGLTFIGLLVGFIFAVLSFGIFDATLYRKASIKANGRPAPEHRLYAGMLGSFMLPIGLFWFAWAPNKDVHWIVPVLAGVPFGWGCLGIFISATTYLVNVYQSENGASAVAANGILRYSFGAAFPLFTIQMYDAIGIHWAGSVFAFISIILMPVPWIFFWKGKVLRARSYYDTSKD